MLYLRDRRHDKDRTAACYSRSIGALRMRVRSRKPRRRRPVQARSMATVDALLSAVAQILVAGGYEGATTNHIARRAGVSVGSLYQYFPDKKALMNELLARHLERRRAAIAAVLTEPSARTPEEAV